MLVFSQVFPFSTAAFASSNFNAWGIGRNLCTRLQWLNEFIPCEAMWSSWSVCGTTFQSCSERLVGIDNTSIFGLALPNTAAGFSALQALLLASEFPTFYDRFSRYVWILHHLGQWRIYHLIFWHYRALVSRWSTFALLCASMHQTFASTYLAIHWQDESLFDSSLVSSLDHVYPLGGLLFNKMNLVKPVHASNNSRSPSMFQ